MARWECANSATPLPLDCRSPTLAAVSSLWTPGGEYKVPRPGEPAPGTDQGAAADTTRSPASGAGGGGGSPDASVSGTSGAGHENEGYGHEDAATEAQLRELARQLAAAPPEDVVANHCYGLFELAALHLSQQPPNLGAARLAIDAMALVVEGLGDRMGSHAATLADGLTQLRLAFVRISDVPRPAAGGNGSANA